jgi:uncharacterized protein YndB with AHSA1/START domain
MKGLVARASTSIDAPPAEVWAALVSPDAVRQYMFGAQVESDWREGSQITWEGEWKGNAYRDKGRILQSRAGEILSYTHFSPLGGKPDVPENYHTVAIRLDGSGESTVVTLEQDNNESEQERRHSQENWETMLEGLKRYVEGER